MFQGLRLFHPASDAVRWKILGVPVVIGGDNLPSQVGIGLIDLPNIGGGANGPPGPPVPASLIIPLLSSIPDSIYRKVKQNEKY